MGNQKNPELVGMMFIFFRGVEASNQHDLSTVNPVNTIDIPTICLRYSKAMEASQELSSSSDAPGADAAQADYVSLGGNGQFHRESVGQMLGKWP